jgi:hypothetical protein
MRGAPNGWHRAYRPERTWETKNQGNIVADGHAPFAMAAL